MLYLKRSLPTWERLLRVAAGIGIAVLALGPFGLAGPLQVLALAGAATALLTAFVGFCPACALLGRRPLDDPK